MRNLSVFVKVALNAMIALIANRCALHRSVLVQEAMLSAFDHSVSEANLQSIGNHLVSP